MTARCMVCVMLAHHLSSSAYRHIGCIPPPLLSLSLAEPSVQSLGRTYTKTRLLGVFLFMYYVVYFPA
jgi:Na+-driven multidrug efflux pump